MIDKLLHSNVQEFIEQHANDDEQHLLLKHKTLFDLPVSTVVWQISGRRKAKTKIPLYYNTKGLVYPPGINLEQSSSEETAAFKASLLAHELNSKETLVDLTGGFGVDSLFFSKVFRNIEYVEPNTALLDYARHNHLVLSANNIQHINATAEEYVNNHSTAVDCFYTDPSRRTSANQKVYRLADCEPDIVELQTKIFRHSKYLMVKTSPMLDLQQGISALQFVKRVWVVAVDNEVKELLFLCEKSYPEQPVITAINLGKEYQHFSFSAWEEKNARIEFSDPLTYVYEPAAPILKSGAFKIAGDRFKLKKLHPSTHLYTSQTLVSDFPGKIFLVKDLIKADSKIAARILPEGKANVITRNYPLSPDELKKKLKLKDGGNRYLIGCSGEKEKFLIVADRLK